MLGMRGEVEPICWLYIRVCWFLCLVGLPGQRRVLDAERGEGMNFGSSLIHASHLCSVYRLRLAYPKSGFCKLDQWSVFLPSPGTLLEFLKSISGGKWHQGLRRGTIMFVEC